MGVACRDEKRSGMGVAWREVDRSGTGVVSRDDTAGRFPFEADLLTGMSSGMVGIEVGTLMYASCRTCCWRKKSRGGTESVGVGGKSSFLILISRLNCSMGISGMSAALGVVA